MRINLKSIIFGETIKTNTMTTLENNIEILVKKLTNKVGYKITHKETAKELLSKYGESTTKTINKLVAKNGICNGKLYFN